MRHTVSVQKMTIRKEKKEGTTIQYNNICMAIKLKNARFESP